MRRRPFFISHPGCASSAKAGMGSLVPTFLICTGPAGPRGRLGLSFLGDSVWEGHSQALSIRLSNGEWTLVAPCLTLLPEQAGHREHSLREVFKRLRYVVKTAAMALDARRPSAVGGRLPAGPALAGGIMVAPVVVPSG